jgi:hypothetical protein
MDCEFNFLRTPYGVLLRGGTGSKVRTRPVSWWAGLEMDADNVGMALNYSTNVYS